MSVAAPRARRFTGAPLCRPGPEENCPCLTNFRSEAINY